MAHTDTVINGVELTRENFRTPPMEMGIVPFWFWNGELEPDELEWQLRQYHDRGVRSLFIHGRMGLKIPYLSETWFDRVKYVVEKASEIGIDTWVYDEMDWPSGTAQKQVLKEYPHLAQRYLELVPLKIDGPLFTFLEAHDSRYVPTGNSNPIAAFGVTQAEFKKEIKTAVDLTKQLSFEKTIPWESPSGKWALLYFLEKEAPWYIDTLDPESTDRFLELTHDRYESAVGKEFGRTVPGFFTDEPALYYFEVGVRNYVVPWTRQMFKIFRERRGYDLKPFLPVLYANMGERTAQLRYDFYRTLTEQYEETYYKRIRDWCDEHGVVFTGHVLFEELLRLQARCEGNIFKYLRQMHVIGVDHLYPKIGSRREPEQHVALKLGSSAAHHFGSTRLLCESMGGTYWDCTLERMKWMANWEYVLGVNLFNNHGYHYSIEGERKRDWPPSQFYHHTWWKYYDRFTTYMARLSHVLSGGRHVARVLVLYPLASIWANFVPQRRDALSRVIEEDFYWLTDTLLRLHYDFDYVDEDVLAEARIEEGRICIRDEEYAILLLPPITHIRPATFDTVRRFVDSGGQLIASTFVPEAFVTTEEDRIDPRQNGAVHDLRDFFGVDSGDLLSRIGSGKIKTEVLHQNSRGEAGKGSIYVIKSRSLKSTRPKEVLRNVLERCAPTDVTISSEEVFYLHRVKDGHDLYFIVNTTQRNLGIVSVTFDRVGRPERWNLETGEIKPIQVFDVVDGRLEIRLRFAPSESYLVVIRDETDEPYIQDTNLEVEYFDAQTVIGYASGRSGPVYAWIRSGSERLGTEAVRKVNLRAIAFPDEYDFSIEQDNVLSIGAWRMAIENENNRGEEYHRARFDDRDWLEVTNGAWEMQLPQERDNASYPVAVWYRTYFTVDELPANPRVLIDGFRGSEYRLYLNGKRVEDRGKRSWLDAEIREEDIGPYVRAGENSIAVRLLVNKRTDGLLDLLKIVGDFSLAGSQEHGFAVRRTVARIRTGDWTKQGFPFYSGTGVYRTEIDIPARYTEGGRLFLEVECGEDVLEVRVNGSEPRVATWHPYRIDVTDLVKPGINSVELKVTNTLINILDGVQRKSGLLKRPRFVHEHRYELKLHSNGPHGLRVAPAVDSRRR